MHIYPTSPKHVAAMSRENSPPTNISTPPRPRRGSLTSNTFAAIFGRSNSQSSPSAPTTNIGSTTSTQNQQRRLSLNTLGLSGAAPIQNPPFSFPAARRGSVSTASSDSIDESAIEDDEGPNRNMPTTPFGRRLSFGGQALFNARTGPASPGATGRTPSYTAPSSTLSPIPQDGRKKSTQASTQSQPRTKSDYSSPRSAEGLNWSEQFRSRAESAVSGRPSFSSSPTNPVQKPFNGSSHERARSVSDMPVPPSATIPAASPPPQHQSAFRRKPDAVGERILRGDFYMD